MSYRSAQDPEENLPEWLKALRRRQGDDAPDEAPSADQPQDETAAESVAGDPPAGASEEQSQFEDASSEEPEWLLEIRRRYKPSGEPAERHIPSEPARFDFSQPEEELSDTQPNPVSRFEDPDPIEEEDEAESALPSWLRPETESAPAFEEIDEEPESAPAFPVGEGDISPGEMPSWLQAIRPNEEEHTRSQAMMPGVEETAGPLAGLTDVLPAQPGVTQFGKAPVFSNRLDVTESHGMHATALRQLLDSEGKPVEDEARRVALPTRVLNLVMSVVLLAAIAFPMLTGSQNSIRPDPNFFPDASAIFNVIDVLPAGAPVLVAFDVQPGLYGEMRPVISAVMAHLLDQQARLVFISTEPAGPTLARRLLAEMFSSVPIVASNEYDELGYLSGGMAALRSFITDPRAAVLTTADGADPWASSSLQLIQGVDDFALVLVVSSSAEDVQAWIEQGAAHLPDGLMAVTSAQAQPLLGVYLRANPLTLRGLVSGVQGAALYERFRGQNGLGSVYWDAYTFGLGAVVLLILLGGLYGRLIQLRPEKTGQRA
jgi:hypothetical protein